IHRGGEDHEAARDAFADGVRALSELFEDVPTAHADRMEMLVRDYHQSCEELGEQPDEDLLAPIAKKLRSLADK
ncbi:MAG: hypothetical protein O7I42_23785, partial [Alphaproteobacteria bacterium]|nr:hypothetical protein [Alphaproteobacteria bacterium]